MHVRMGKTGFGIDFKSSLLYFFLIFLPNLSSAQEDTSATTKKPAAFLFNFDARNTFIDRKHINIWGLRAGVSFGKKSHRITAGYYWLSYNSKNLIQWKNALTPTVSFSPLRQTDVQFISLAYWYPVLKTKKWTLLAPVEFGIGKKSSHYKDFFEDLLMRRKERYFQPFQAGLYAEHRLTPWAGISVQAGYRNAISKGNISGRFGGIYYSYGITLYPEKIYKDIKNWKKEK